MIGPLKGVAGKEDVTFFRGWGGLQVLDKKIKSGLFNDKKSLNKNACSVVTKNPNWEIFTKNLVTFRR